MNERSARNAMLIIDDDQGSCETLRDIFEEEGYTIVTAQDGKSGLKALRKGRFQVALVDIKLPDIDGVNLIGRIRQQDPHLYIIMITAFATIENTIEALNRGAYSYFTKPLNIEEVKTRIGKAVQHYRNDEDRRRLAGEVRRRAAELDTIARITTTINASLNVHDVFRTVAEEVGRLLPYDWTRICLIENGKTLRVFAEADGTGLTAPAGGRGERRSTEGPIERWILLNREPLLIPDLTDDNPFRVDPAVYRRSIRSLLVVPLISRGRAIGIYYLGSREPRVYREEHLNLLKQIGGQFSVAIDNARAYEELLDAKESLEKDVIELKGKVGEKFTFENMIVKSGGMKKVLDLVSRVLESDSTVLLQGESGTGKELLAHILHYNGPRRDRPFVTVNCGAIPEHLLESELFGFERGAFTGADRAKEGLLERAHEGTFFLDEIDELPKNLQVKLLRVLQDGEIRRLGDVDSRRVDVRLVAATNRDILQLVREKKFREDLFYRLNVFPLVIPPLRERREDILPLAEYFLERYRGKARGELTGFSPAAKKALVAYHWPGNVRELENVVEKSVHIARGEWIEPDDLGLSEIIHPDRVDTGSFEEQREAFTKSKIEEVLRKNLGNKARTARELGIHRTQLYRYLEKFGLG